METTTTASASIDGDDRRAAIQARIERPRTLGPELAAQVLPRIKELTSLAGTTSPEDPKNLLTAGWRLIAAPRPPSTRASRVAVDTVVCEATVARWSQTAKRERMPDERRANYLRFLITDSCAPATGCHPGASS